MGKKKKKSDDLPFCWYCTRTFEDEKVLIQHQKAKHFKCHICHKKLTTAGGMAIHVYQVHKENITKVPNAKPGRDSIKFEIFGMEGIPDNIDEEQPYEAKRLKTDTTPASPPPLITPVIPPNLPGIAPSSIPTQAVPPPLPPAYQGYPMPMPPMYGAPPMGPGWGMPHMAPGWGMPPANPWMGGAPMGYPPAPVMPPTPPGIGSYPSPKATTPPHTTLASSSSQPTNPQMILIYDDEDVSMEEKRAELETYRYDEEKIKEQVSKLNSSIESRLSSIKGFSY